MQNLALKLSTTPDHHVGWLARVDRAELVVKTDTGVIRARRAPSCLVAPEQGDLVLVTTLEAGAAFVVAVLEREPGRAATLVAEAGLNVRVPNGAFTVSASDGVEIAAEHAFEITAGELEVDAARASFKVTEASFVADLVRTEIDRARHVARTVESVFERVTERVKRAYRTIEEFEQVRAARIDYQAKTTLSLHGENTVLTAEELVKIDAEQIHLG